MNNKFSIQGLILRGLSMGIAEVIPGVSGGPLAFISGIYDILIHSIKSFNVGFFRLLIQGKFKEAYDYVNGSFLVLILVGMVCGIGIGIFGITWLLEHYPEPLWSLFFGCILASVPYMFLKIHPIRLSHFIFFGFGAIVAVTVCLMSPTIGNTAYWYVFLSGMIAVSALLLPGVSGSFILVLMGLYTVIIPQIKQFLSTFDFSLLPLLFVFGLGLIVGLAGFSRLLSYVFKYYYKATLATLSGFLMGSLIKVWPWRNPVAVLDETRHIVRPILESELNRSLFSNAQIKIAQDILVVPQQYFTEPYFLVSIICFLSGMGIVYWLSKVEHKN